MPYELEYWLRLCYAIKTVRCIRMRDMVTVSSIQASPRPSICCSGMHHMVKTDLECRLEGTGEQDACSNVCLRGEGVAVGVKSCCVGIKCQCAFACGEARICQPLAAVCVGACTCVRESKLYYLAL